MAGLLVVAAAGFFTRSGRSVFLTGLVLFALTMAIYVAGWFPLLQGIVPHNERGRFFGGMRMSWQIVVSIVLFASLWVVGKNASIRTLQLILGGAALLILGRLFFISRIPESPRKQNAPRLSVSVKAVLANKRLRRFSVYIVSLYLFSSATIPMALVFAKLELGVPDNFLVLLSASVNIGSVIGFLLGGHLVDRLATHGLVHGASTIAASSEILGLAAKTWILFGLRMSQFHTFFAGYGLILCAGFVLVFLVPGIRTKRTYLPGY
jgi:Na+/melibiose symporter-like transporter